VDSRETKRIEAKKGFSPQSLNVVKTVNNIFSYLVIILAILILLTGGFLIYSFSSKKNRVENDKIPQLQNYLYQLKDSEIQLKNLVKQQQEKVVSADELSRNIINSMDVAIILLNKGNKIEIFNKAAEKIFNKSMVFAKNNSFNIVFSDFKEIVKLVNGDDKNKGFFEVESNKRFFRIDKIIMKNIGCLFIIDDITEDKKKDAIIQRNKNFVMLGEMAAFLVHEVRNSLGVIYGYTRTVPEKSDKIDKVNKEILFLTDMMERFLNFSKPLKDEEKKKVEVKKMMFELAEKNGIECEIIGEDILLETDSIQFQTVISNLFRNAVEASATKIDIELENAGKTIVKFKDNGTGIKEVDINKVWFPFFTTKKKGTGMGLALVKKYLYHLNGDITIIDSGSNGTEFKIELY
jgi:nitrogen fixation/metabolism regulation signal transduction histidine kinase